MMTKATEKRFDAIKTMHNVMLSMNNENAYGAWIYTVPDEPSEWDFEDIASDEEFFDECVELFDRLYKRYADDGLFRPGQSDLEFLTAHGYKYTVV